MYIFTFYQILVHCEASCSYTTSSSRRLFHHFGLCEDEHCPRAPIQAGTRCAGGPSVKRVSLRLSFPLSQKQFPPIPHLRQNIVLHIIIGIRLFVRFLEKCLSIITIFLPIIFENNIYLLYTSLSLFNRAKIISIICIYYFNDQSETT